MITKEEYLTAVETLEAIYFLTMSLEGQGEAAISQMRNAFENLDENGKERLLKSIRNDIVSLREHYGAIAPDEKYRELLHEACGRRGYAYLSKLNIDRYWFRNYEKVFPRWPHVPLHGLVVFDGQTNRSLRQIFTPEGALYTDIRFFLKITREVHKGISDFRKREQQDQRALLAYARAAVTTTFHFLEAYLNGLAYDCFKEHHDQLALEEHDMLAEWNTKEKKRRYVRFETKLFEYPRIVAKTYGKALDLSDFKPAKLLAMEGKDIRDALTHPSPYVDPKSGVEEKTFWVTGVGFEAAEQLFNAAREYVLAVEQGVGKDPQKTMSWFFD